MAKYIFCILACAFLVLGFSNVSDKELQGFQKETGISANDMQYKAESCCRVSSAGFDKSGKDSHSQFVDETSNLVTAFLTISLFREALFLSRT